MAEDDIPAGYELAEVSHAKEHALESLVTDLYRQGINPHDEEHPIDMIGLADAVVERLLREGVTIPESIASPFTPEGH